jgi:hypothetical protein
VSGESGLACPFPGPSAASIWAAALDRVKLVRPLDQPVEDASFWFEGLSRRTEEYHRTRGGRR